MVTEVILQTRDGTERYLAYPKGREPFIIEVALAPRVSIASLCGAENEEIPPPESRFFRWERKLADGRVLYREI